MEIRVRKTKKRNSVKYSKEYLKEITKSINRLCKFLNEHYNINCGGCCFLAAAIAKELDNLNIKYTLKIYDPLSKNRKDIKLEVSNKKRNLNNSSSVTGVNNCSHYGLFILNGGGFINPCTRPLYKTYTIPNINYTHINWIYKAGNWNDYYKPSNNKHIRIIVKEFFKTL